ncbi:MAG: hypothetical protein ACPLKZ_00990 [Candidatus Bathyarchaeales archaeon]
MRCNRCLAEVSIEEKTCPKCGSTVFTGEADNSAIRNTIQFFSTPMPFYIKAKPPTVVNSELVSFETEWKLYMARLQQNAPSIFLWDRDGYLPGKQEAALHLVDPEDLSAIIAGLPIKKREKLRKVLQNEWAIQVEDDEDLLNKIKGIPLFYQPVPRLRDPNVLKSIDWKCYVESLACPKPGKDSRLVAVHLAKLLQPLSMFYAPHSLEVTNSNTGKTRFYDAAGVKVDKATRKAVLGFAKSPEEVYPGTINGTSVPIAFDQVESQDSYELARYMLDVLETGKALVDSGGIRFAVVTHSSFAYLGNPIAKDAKVLEGFKALLDHVCANPAMGRRFGIILFGTDLKTIQSSEKMSLQELDEWKANFTLFRAVEEYAQPKLKQLIMDKQVSEWLHQPIKGYREAILHASEQLEDYNLAAFFESHAEASHRVRGAALHAAIALLLDKFALGEVSVGDVIAEAEELLTQYVKINLDSIATLCQMWDALKADQAKAFYANCPDYLREIISACILYKKEKPETVTVALSAIPYQPENYEYFSKCVDRLKRRKNIQSLNETLRSFFGFQLIQNDGNFNIEYFENTKPPEDLKTVGFLNFSNFSISQFTQTPTFSNKHLNESGSEETTPAQETTNTQENKNGVSVNVEKLRKMRNGEKIERGILSVVSLTRDNVGLCAVCNQNGQRPFQVNFKDGSWALLCRECGQSLQEHLKGNEEA